MCSETQLGTLHFNILYVLDLLFYIFVFFTFHDRGPSLPKVYINQTLDKKALHSLA